MEERHEQEQYFYSRDTVLHLADFVQTFSFPCCLCTPLVGQELVKRGKRIRILDIDTRFSQLPGFCFYDLYRPKWLEEEYDLIICDPPFFKVSLSQLFQSIRLLSHYNMKQPLLISYLKRRAASLIGTFSPFGLAASGYSPDYLTVQMTSYNEIEFFTNLPKEKRI